MNRPMSRPVLITGGAGFIGSNLTHALACEGRRVRVFDNLTRSGVRQNAEWLARNHRGEVEIIEGDVRDPGAVLEAASEVCQVYHLAGQVAVTTSVSDPRLDFEVNALGTLNVLEAARAQSVHPTVFFTSTNKVYGGMEDVAICERAGRYEYRDLADGVEETRPLDFHSPYGCSKGASDQYVRDYGRIYGIPTVVFRMSCIYGRRQYGNEDQGWVAHFVRAAVSGQPLTIFGDGKQVRDVLFADDLVRAFHLAGSHLERTRGQVYNIGGGAKNTLSLLELLDLLGRITQGTVPAAFEDWRPGDQRVYVSNVGKARRDFGWEPSVGVVDGVRMLHAWVVDEMDLPARELGHATREPIGIR